MKTAAAFLLALALSAEGCASEPKVVRVYDDRIVEGPYVPPEAYGAYLRGVLAESEGNLRGALAAYEAAEHEDDEDPELPTRVGDARCRLDPHDKAADDAFARALSIDRAYAPTAAARAHCAGLRGHPDEGARELAAIAPQDRLGPSLEALAVRLAAARAPGSDDRRMRDRAIALTVASGTEPAAWEALATWGRARGEADLLARGLEGLARAAPARSAEIEAGALELLGIGEDVYARHVAAALADLPEDHGGRRVQDPTVARLAVDEAILRADEDHVVRRAARGRIPLPEAAARALILERRALAETLARRVADADPGSSAARMVLAAAETGSAPSTAASTDRPAAACALVFADRLAVAGGAEAARRWLREVASGAMAPRDPVVAPLAVDLAARGVFPEASLPPELRLELAARRREAPPRVAGLGTPESLRALDPKHALLWYALVDPGGAAATQLLARMRDAADRDPIVGFSLGRAVLASTASTPAPSGAAWTAALRAVAGSPSHPLLLAIAVELAKRDGHAEELPPARTRLMAVARTPAERALATE